MIKLACKLEIAQAGNTGQLESCKLEVVSWKPQARSWKLAGQLEI